MIIYCPSWASIQDHDCRQESKNFAAALAKIPLFRVRYTNSWYPIELSGSWSDMIFFGRGSQTELPQTSERSNYSQRLIVRRYAKSRICKRQAIDYERKGTDIEDGRQLDREILSNGSAALYNRNTYLLTPQLLPADFNLLELPLCSLMDWVLKMSQFSTHQYRPEISRDGCVLFGYQYAPMQLKSRG